MLKSSELFSAGQFNPEVNRKLHYFIFSFITQIQSTRKNTRNARETFFNILKIFFSQSQTELARYDQDSGNDWLCLNRGLMEDPHLSIKFTYRSPKPRIGELDRGRFINSGRFLHKNERFQKFEGEEKDGEDSGRSRIPRLMQDGRRRTERPLCSLAGAAVTSSARRRASQNVSVSRKNWAPSKIWRPLHRWEKKQRNTAGGHHLTYTQSISVPPPPVVGCSTAVYALALLVIEQEMLTKTKRKVKYPSFY